MPDYSPIFSPGIAITLAAAVDITAGDLVEVAGSGTVRPASGASPSYVGVAGQAATPGLLVTVFAGKIVHEGRSEGAITARGPGRGVRRRRPAGQAGRRRVAGHDRPGADTAGADDTDVRWMQY